MKYSVQLLNYEIHFRHHERQAIIIENFANVNIFVQHKIQKCTRKISAEVSLDSILISMSYKNP